MDGVESSRAESSRAESSAVCHQSAGTLIAWLSALPHAQILSTSPILEAFGNAKTVRNNNSSRFGKLFEIHYSRNEHSQLSIAGARIQNYLLEKSRIAAQGNGERNYHVFYYLSNGVKDPGRRKELKLLNPSQYAYLKQAAKLEWDDSKMLAQLQKSMSVVGLSAEIQKEIFAILSAVLRLGNVQFAQVEEYGDADAVVVTAVAT